MKSGKTFFYSNYKEERLMKRGFPAAFICVMLLPMLIFSASATEFNLPFTLTAPENVSASWLEGNDSPTTTAIAYSLSNEMTDFFKRAEEAHEDDTFADLMAKYDCDDISITTQVDWAVDDVNDSVSGWHCNEYWNADYGFGYDSEYRIRVGEWDGVDLWIGNAADTVNKHWITRGVTEEAFNGNPDTKTPGLKDQLRPEQYTYEDGELRIDYTQHTVFFRMRFVVTTSKDTEEGTKNQYFYSDWSNTAAVGKGADSFEGLTEKNLPAPEITGLHKTDKEFNGCPVVAFTLTVPDALAANHAKVTAAGGGIFIETYARVKGDTVWTEMGNTDFTVSAGERECALISLVNQDRPNIPKDTVIELRCRYRCAQPEKDDVYSEYSRTISFGTDDIQQSGDPGQEGTGTDAPVDPVEKTCPICHFCPQPLGLCIFIWLLIILGAIAVIIVIVKKKKKESSKQ